MTKKEFMNFIKKPQKIKMPKILKIPTESIKLKNPKELKRQKFKIIISSNLHL